jgi:hypothetical protein
LPDDPAITVYARNGAKHLISAPPSSLERLSKEGFSPVPIDPRASVPAPPVRAWKRITEPDPRVQAMVDAVTWPHVRGKIRRLEKIGTRYAYAPEIDVAADTLYAFFVRQNLPVEFHEFEHGGRTMRNVVATQVGATRPDSVFVVCAHYDSVSEKPMISAPGADDNASGTTAVQLVAQFLAPHSFEYTIQYVCFTAEEIGLVGSQAFAAEARQAGRAIVGALNFDMLGWWKPGVDFDLEIESNRASRWLMDAITNAADLYTTMPYQTHVNDAAWWGDHASFWGEGYHAINHEESYDWDDPDFNPAYHTSTDVLSGIHEDFALGNTRIAVAAVATLARLTSPTAAEATSFSRFKARFLPGEN